MIRTHLLTTESKPRMPVSHWLDTLNQGLGSIQFKHPQIARFVCQLIPSQCPFERDIQVCGQILFHIPALCKLNPFYDGLMSLRFQALSFLADTCGEDISRYCR